MSSTTSSPIQLVFKGKLPNFIAGPPITFTDLANQNFMKFFYILLNSSSHNAQFFRNTLNDILQSMKETHMCYCKVQTTPLSEKCYNEKTMQAKLCEYAKELEQSHQEFPHYILKNMGLMVLLSLLGRSLIGSQDSAAINYTQPVDDSITFRRLAEKFDYQVDQVGEIFHFTGMALKFQIPIESHMLANHSDVVQVLKFRPETPPTAAKNLKRQDQDGLQEDGTKSIDVDTAFEPSPMKGGPERSRLPIQKPELFGNISERDNSKSSWLLKEKVIRNEVDSQLSRAQRHQDLLPNRRFNYFREEPPKLFREKDYNSRYKL